jgi:hypothetical protein
MLLPSCALLASAALRRCGVTEAVEFVSRYTAEISGAFAALRSGSLQQLLVFVLKVVGAMEATHPGSQGALLGFKMGSLEKIKVGHIVDATFCISPVVLLLLLLLAAVCFCSTFGLGKVLWASCCSKGDLSASALLWLLIVRKRL